MPSCLLLACSKAKLLTPTPLPALMRYDGGSYRVVRKAMRLGNVPPDLHITILSAQFGLLCPSDPIPFYDRLMDRERAEELKAIVSARLDEFLREIRPSTMFTNLGKTYRLAISSSAEYKLLHSAGAVREASGPPGIRMRELNAWLCDLRMPTT